MSQSAALRSYAIYVERERAMSKCVTCKQDKDKWSDENEYAQCEVCSMVDYFNQEVSA